ncbi:WXG100 family type VII secretion target [Streptomyces sp. NPDC001678]|uniref:WXG100 family type VII secretion target n=1 Tax=Streptomyces sp. NPDC001678 TaxID=3364599 RepID=UPI0036C2200D
MSGKQKVNDEAFRTFTNALDQSSQAFTANLRTLANAIATVDGGQWKGQAHDVFRAAQEELNREHDAVRRLIDHVRDAVAKTHTSTGATDEEIAASVKGVSAIHSY